MPFIVDPLDDDFSVVATIPENAYTVALRDFADLPDKERMAAEIRYCKALERRFGSGVGVADALRAVLALEDGGQHADGQAQALRWRMANAAARQAGLQGLGEPAEAYFDVCLA